MILLQIASASTMEFNYCRALHVRYSTNCVHIRGKTRPSDSLGIRLVRTREHRSPRRRPCRRRFWERILWRSEREKAREKRTNASVQVELTGRGVNIPVT